MTCIKAGSLNTYWAWRTVRPGQGRGKVLNAAVMANNKARVSHIQIWK